MSVHPSLLGGLGKATRRGVRKCPKCNTVNGTRGLSCKNKSCDFVFKEPNPEGKKLICPSVLPGSLYSVRHSSSSRAFIYVSQEGNSSYCSECGYGPCKRMPSTEQEALPFTLKVSVLNGLAIDDSLKHEIYSRAKEPGPLVQRVSRSWMVVKRASHEKESPVPFVHIRFGVKFYNCSCSEHTKCFHFLASLAVFAGDPLLSKEFSRFTALLTDEEASPLLSIQDTNGETLQVSLVEEEDLHQELDLLTASLDEPNLHPLPEEIYAPASSILLKKPSSTLYPFNDWLASVTESINQSMHYQLSAPQGPLVFRAPQTFFNQLRDRISSTSKEYHHSSSTILRRDAPPFGSFTKYSWRLTNIFHVKDVFDTESVPLDITRNFVQNKDGSFDFVAAPAEAEFTHSNNNVNRRSLLIRRHPELKTYLKVGQMSADSKDCVPFIIEWIPDILPIMKVGELRIMFEYGHNRNGGPLDNVQNNLRLRNIHPFQSS